MAANLILVAEASSDVALLRLLLGKELSQGMRFFAAQGRISLISLARNVLVHEGEPVLVVMNADTLNPHLREEQHSLAMAALSGVGSQGMFDVFTFVPEIEIVYFEADGVLERWLEPLSQQTKIESRLTPKHTLEDLLTRANIPSVDALVRRLDESAAQLLRAGKQASTFLRQMQLLTSNAGVFQQS